MTFRFHKKTIHLTYKGFAPEDEVRAMAESFGTIKRWSFVHENGDTDEENPTPYEHTHVAIAWEKNIDTTNVKAFDMGQVHPNIAPGGGMKWFRNLCMKYHRGHKTKKDGKKYFIEPVFINQEFIDDWRWEDDQWDLCVGAPSLQDACLELGIVPKSISDVKLIRSQSKKRKAAEMEDGLDAADFKTIEWDRKKALVFRGTAGIGKTNWAVSQFKSPIIVTDIEDLRNLPVECDGLVFDEMLFDWPGIKKITQINVCDMAFERTIRMRHTNAKIPKGMPRIFCCNEHEHTFGMNPHESVTRRYNEIFHTEPLWQ